MQIMNVKRHHIRRQQAKERQSLMLTAGLRMKRSLAQTGILYQFLPQDSSFTLKKRKQILIWI